MSDPNPTAGAAILQLLFGHPGDMIANGELVRRTTANVSLQARFRCESGDKTTLLVDAPDAYPGEVVISAGTHSRKVELQAQYWIVVTPTTARQIAAAIIHCAEEAEKHQEQSA